MKEDDNSLDESKKIKKTTLMEAEKWSGQLERERE